MGFVHWESHGPVSKMACEQCHFHKGLDIEISVVKPVVKTPGLWKPCAGATGINVSRYFCLISGRSAIGFNNFQRKVFS